jgi:hypothetical protein
MRRRLIVSSLLVLLFAGGGCGGDDGGAPPPVTHFPVAGCESFDTAPCDVLTIDCQTRLFGLATCMRGSAAGPLPTITRMTEAEYAQLLMTRYTSAAPRPDPDHAERGLTLLGLVETGAFTPSAMAAARAGWVRGEYRSDTNDIVLVDHGEPAADVQVNGTLLHEFVHALQDRDADLPTWFETHATSFDRTLAAMSVVEGEARMHQERFGASLLGLDPSAVDWPRAFDNRVAGAEAWVLEQPSPYLASYSAFPYEHGARLLSPRFAAFGPQAVTETFTTPPPSTRALMVEPASPAVPAGPALAPPTTPPDWTLIDSDTLGSWGLFLMLSSVTPAEAARREALGWRGDHLWIYGATAPLVSTAVVWKVSFADEATATTMLPFAIALLPNIRAQRDGAQITMAVADSSLPLDWAFVPPSP